MLGSKRIMCGPVGPSCRLFRRSRVLVLRPYPAVDAEGHVHRGRVRVAGVDVRLPVLEHDDGLLLTRTCDIGGHVDPGIPRAQMEVVDGGAVGDLKGVLAGRERRGDLSPVFGREVDLVGIWVVRGSDGADELREARSRRRGGSLVVAVAASDRRECDDRQPDGKRQANCPSRLRTGRGGEASSWPARRCVPTAAPSPPAGLVR
jgi:hypothetical protein